MRNLDLKIPDDFELKLPKETRNEFGYTPSEEKVIEKQMATMGDPKSKGAWKRFVKANEEAEKEKAADKKHLTKLYIHGMENSQEPVIKNPVLRKALEAKPKPKKSVNYLSNNYSFEENFKKQSKNINDYKPTAKKPFKTVPKIKSGEPVKIDFKLDPMHTAGLWSNIKKSSLYKLLDNPKVMGVELGHEGIMEAYNLLQNSGLLKKGGRVK